MSMLDYTLKPAPVRRLEVITGTGRRRRFPDDFKAGVVEETLAPGAVVSEIARRHGLYGCYRVVDGLLKVTMASHSGNERILACQSAFKFCKPNNRP